MARTHSKPFLTMGKVALITAVIYAILVAIHLALSVFTKTIDVLPDELRYLDTLRSLASDGTLVIRGDESSFQKILYPLMLMPAMVFTDPQEQIEAIAILNCLYACSLVFPVYLMARKLFRSPAWVLAMVCIMAAFPEICYSATFMSETVYVPLALWVTMALWNLLEHPHQNHPGLFLLAGILCYLAYLCKEVGLCFLLATTAMMLAELRFPGKDRRFAVLVRLAFFLAGFCIVFLAMKLTLFQGMGNSYNQSSLEALLSPYATLFGILSIGVNFTYLLVGFCIVPLLLPAIMFRTLPPSQRKLASLVYLCLAICFLAIVYTISIREDSGNDVIRQHLRYLSCFLPPLVMLTACCIMESPRTSKHRTPRRYAVALCTAMMSAFAICVFYGLGDLSQGFDTGLLHLHRVIAEADAYLPVSYYFNGQLHLEAIPATGSGIHAINWAIWLAKALLVVATLGLMWLCLFGSRRLAAGITMTVIFGLFAANSICCSLYNYNAYHVADSFVEATEDLTENLRALPDDAVVALVYDEDNTLVNNLLDTYAVPRCRDHIVYTNTVVINADITQGYLLDTKLLTDFGIAGTGSEETKSIDYLVFNVHQGYTISGAGAQEVPLGYSNLYEVYRVVPGLPFYVERPDDAATGSSR